jgi:hypothetical protein
MFAPKASKSTKIVAASQDFHPPFLPRMATYEGLQNSSHFEVPPPFPAISHFCSQRLVSHPAIPTPVRFVRVRFFTVIFRRRVLSCDGYVIFRLKFDGSHQDLMEKGWFCR